MKEVISIFSGEIGVGIGRACLEQLAEEHGIASDGFFKDEKLSLAEIYYDVHFRQNSFGQ